MGTSSGNYIKGLFLSSGIIRDPDYTMKHLAEVARVLREVHDFRSYIHLKTVPEASPKFAPVGQSTRMIVGADDARDRDVM